MSATDPYILVGSGQKFYFNRPHEFKFDIRHIAGALSRLCRFTGHTSEFYSVAQHSVFCSNIVDPKFALEALLHDAAEAFVGDLNSPLKSIMPQYRAVEAPVQAAIYQFFGCENEGNNAGNKSPEVHRADMVALATEKRDLMPFDAEEWECLQGVDPHPFPLVALDSRLAERDFLERFTCIQYDLLDDGVYDDSEYDDSGYN